MNTPVNFYFMDEKQITVYFEYGKAATWKSDHPRFQHIIDAAKANNWVEIEFWNNPTAAIINNTTTIADDNKTITIKQKDTEVPFVTEASGDPLLEMIALLQRNGTLGNDIEPVKPFLINMLKNPYIKAHEEIYEYCRNMDFEITPDGCFLAYKNVRQDLGSIYDDGKTKHVIGGYTEVTEFDTDRHNMCSQGLHFCTKSYLKNYGGDTTIVVKINPMDVVSIPIDYNFTKGRCKRYLTIGIIAPDGTMQTTNIEVATGEKVIKTEVKAKANKKFAQNKAKNLGRIKETAQNMEIYKNDVAKVASIMQISVETVKRNMRKYRTK